MPLPMGSHGALRESSVRVTVPFAAAGEGRYAWGPRLCAQSSSAMGGVALGQRLRIVASQNGKDLGRQVGGAQDMGAL